MTDNSVLGKAYIIDLGNGYSEIPLSKDVYVRYPTEIGEIHVNDGDLQNTIIINFGEDPEAFIMVYDTDLLVERGKSASDIRVFKNGEEIFSYKTITLRVPKELVHNSRLHSHLKNVKGFLKALLLKS